MGTRIANHQRRLSARFVCVLLTFRPEAGHIKCVLLLRLLLLLLLLLLQVMTDSGYAVVCPRLYGDLSSHNQVINRCPPFVYVCVCWYAGAAGRTEDNPKGRVARSFQSKWLNI